MIRLLAVACVLLGLAAGLPVRSQRIPQVTGWSYSRSNGMGTQNRSAVSSRSDSSGQQIVIESGNVELIKQPDGTTAYRILDPAEKFGSFSQSTRSDERSRFQGLSLFTLSDWGYSIFSN